ncbi:hypothetical protein ACT2FY_08740 [Paraburkholderia fungorum]|uniref:hypothetical protein n=1 Tax=Paraburkholderia fungorum TaxID=134537 RepID=UPI00402BA61A
MYNHFIQTFIDAQTAAWRHYNAIAATEMRFFGDTSSPAVRVPGGAQIEAELKLVYETLALRIIEKARDRFAVGRARPTVSRSELYRRAGFDIDRSLAAGEVPDFDLLWTVLESQLGNIGAPAGER